MYTQVIVLDLAAEHQTAEKINILHHNKMYLNKTVTDRELGASLVFLVDESPEATP